MILEFMHIDELALLMTEEQKKKARLDYEKYFLEPYGDQEPVWCTSDDDGEDYLRYVDLEDFD